MLALHKLYDCASSLVLSGGPPETLGLGVGQDPGMVKCEVNVAHIDPFGAHRVRPHSRPSLVRKLGHECHAHNMASRVAIDIGVDSDEGDRGNVYSGFLPDFATAGGHDSFADLHETAWQCMFSRAGFMPRGE